ncbi:MAG: hypothetical protein ACRECO_06110 [Xanthobacteraceae bacterium]
MWKLVLACLLCAPALVAAEPAAADIWCLRTPGSDSKACVFSSGRDCAMAARFSAFGGVCERQQLGSRGAPDRRRSERQWTWERGRADRWRRR